MYIFDYNKNKQSGECNFVFFYKLVYKSWFLDIRILNKIFWLLFF